MRVEEVMTKEVWSCRPEDMLSAAAQLMWEHDVGCVPVVEDGRVVGMLTDRDICMSAHLTGGRLAEIPVSSVMSERVITCGPHESISVAEDRMRSNQIRRLPVVEADRIVGVLSLNDIVLAWQHPPSIVKSDLPAEEVVETMARICEHRNGQSPPGPR